MLGVRYSFSGADTGVGQKGSEYQGTLIEQLPL